MDRLRLKSRLLCTLSRRHRRALRELVTPFTPYLLSDFYLSRDGRFVPLQVVPLKRGPVLTLLRRCRGPCEISAEE